jgi:cobyrinic acid a,c-diamide synthase
MHHSEIAGRASYNLDLWMSSEQHVRSIVQERMADADVGIIEGVMGLFDGARRDEGSSAAIARLLNVKVILIVDASSVAYSVAPLLFGFQHFDTRISLGGVIFNKVAGPSHYQFLKEAADDAGVQALGYVPRNKALAIEDRHLGLHLPGESREAEIVFQAASLIRKHVDVDSLVNNCNCKIPSEKETFSDEETPLLTIAIACDQAFNFSYRANIDCLEKLGKVRYFSPLNDESVPDADVVWLSGGYPELYGPQLSQNRKMQESIKKLVENDKIVIAECGGMMYLGQSIISQDGDVHNMVGLFNYSTSFKQMKLHLGYRQVFIGKEILKGHEFHYSELVNNSCSKGNYEVQNARGKKVDMAVFRYKKVWASYMHLYLGEMDKMKRFLSHLSQG